MIGSNLPHPSSNGGFESEPLDPATLANRNFSDIETRLGFLLGESIPPISTKADKKLDQRLKNLEEELEGVRKEFNEPTRSFSPSLLGSRSYDYSTNRTKSLVFHALKIKEFTLIIYRGIATLFKLYYLSINIDVSKKLEDVKGSIGRLGYLVLHPNHILHTVPEHIRTPPIHTVYGEECCRLLSDAILIAREIIQIEEADQTKFNVARICLVAFAILGVVGVVKSLPILQFIGLTYCTVTSIYMVITYGKGTFEQWRHIYNLKEHLDKAREIKEKIDNEIRNNLPNKGGLD